MEAVQNWQEYTPLLTGSVGRREKAMKLRALTIRNFASIGEPGLTIPIDDIVVLIGPNNSGKSSVLRVKKFINWYYET